MGGGAPFDSCYHFHGSPIMAGILRLSVLLYQELLIRIRLNLPSDMRSNNIGFLRYITPLLSRRLSSRFIRFAFPNSVQTRHMAALLLRPLSILGRHTRIDIMPSYHDHIVTA